MDTQMGKVSLKSEIVIQEAAGNSLDYTIYCLSLYA